MVQLLQNEDFFTKYIGIDVVGFTGEKDPRNLMVVQVGHGTSMAGYIDATDQLSTEFLKFGIGSGFNIELMDLLTELRIFCMDLCATLKKKNRKFEHGRRKYFI